MVTLVNGANNAAYVAPGNTGATYDNFCLHVEDIALHLGIPPSDAEERLMSNGGRHRGAWRAYVIGFPI